LSGVPSGLFPSKFLAKILYVLMSVPYMLHALLISSSLVWLTVVIIGEESNYEVRYCQVFSILLLYPFLRLQHSYQQSVIVIVIVIYFKFNQIQIQVRK
jgi:hypothetical protein